MLRVKFNEIKRRVSRRSGRLKAANREGVPERAEVEVATWYERYTFTYMFFSSRKINN